VEHAFCQTLAQSAGKSVALSDLSVSGHAISHDPAVRSHENKKPANRVKPTRVDRSEDEEMLPGSDTSGGQDAVASPLEDDAEGWPYEQRRSRGKNRPSDSLACARGKPFSTQGKPFGAQGRREADHHPGATRVRFEFARRAHQKKCTPRVGINRAERKCQGESGEEVEKSFRKFREGK
jgi:hypothetical protein